MGSPLPAHFLCTPASDGWSPSFLQCLRLKLQGPQVKRYALPACPGRAPGMGLPGPSTHPRPSAPRLEDDGTHQAHMGLNWSVASWVGSVYSHAKPPACAGLQVTRQRWPPLAQGPRELAGGNFLTFSLHLKHERAPPLSFWKRLSFV